MQQYRHIKTAYRHACCSVAACLGILLTGACTADIYDKGNGPLSSLYCTIAQAHTDAQCRVTTLVNDDGTTLALQQPITASWLTTPDSTYCIQVYYNRESMQVYSVSQVLALAPVVRQQTDHYQTDPVISASCWLSANKRQMYMGLRFKHGRTDDTKAHHTFTLLYTGTDTHANGRSTATYTLSHNQGGIPLQYEAEQYFSLSTDGIAADTLCIGIPTFEGQQVMKLAIASPSHTH